MNQAASSASLHLPDLREALPWLTVTDCNDPRQSVCWSEPQREGKWTQVVINLPSAGTPGQLWKEMCKSRKRTLPWPTRIGGQLYCLHPTPVNLMAPYVISSCRLYSDLSLTRRTKTIHISIGTLTAKEGHVSSREDTGGC